MLSADDSLITMYHIACSNIEFLLTVIYNFTINRYLYKNNLCQTLEFQKSQECLFKTVK